MKCYCVDIETSARDNAAEFLPEVDAPANYRDEIKIKAYLEEKRKSQLERAALSAETARILCVGLLREEWPVSFVDDVDERDLLIRTWDALGAYKDDEQFVTFNGARFDWPMLARRSYALGVRIPGWFPLDGRWKNSRHCDLMELWQCGNRGDSISLDTLARLTGVGAKSGNGADFARLWRDDRAAALTYLTHDLELTRSLWLRMR